MEKKQTFWADAQLTEHLATIPRSEKSTIIRMALRAWFNLPNCRPIETTVTPEVAQQVARELMKNLQTAK